MDGFQFLFSVMKESISLLIAIGTFWFVIRSYKLSAENQKLTKQALDLSRENVDISQQSQQILKASLNLTKELKSTDVLIDCSRRYDLRVEERQNLIEKYREADNAPNDNPVRQYYHRFWLLQWDQFCFYQRGYVDEHIFRNWLDERHDEWERNRVIGGVSYRDGWVSSKEKYLKDEEFTAFMENVFRGRAREAIDKLKGSINSSEQ